MKIYIAGKISGLNHDEVFRKFDIVQCKLTKRGNAVLVPTVLPVLDELTHEDYMHICYAMIDVCDAVYFLRDYKESKGAVLELAYARKHGKQLLFEDNQFEYLMNKSGLMTDLALRYKRIGDKDLSEFYRKAALGYKQKAYKVNVGEL